MRERQRQREREKERERERGRERETERKKESESEKEKERMKRERSRETETERQTGWEGGRGERPRFINSILNERGMDTPTWKTDREESVFRRYTNERKGGWARI